MRECNWLTFAYGKLGFHLRAMMVVRFHCRLAACPMPGSRRHTGGKSQETGYGAAIAMVVEAGRIRLDAGRSRSRKETQWNPACCERFSP